MKYNTKYDRWVSKDGLVYRYDKKKDKLVLAKSCYVSGGYIRYGIMKNHKHYGVLVHRLVWETFMGEIPNGMVIDHINTIRDDNRLDNLRCVTQKENCNNPLTKVKNSESKKGKSISVETREKIANSLKGHTPPNKGKYKSEFTLKFIDYFKVTPAENWNLWNKEHTYWFTHNKVCRWEVEDK